LPAQAFAKGVPGNKRFKLGDDLGVAAKRDVGLDPLFERAQAQLLEPRDVSLSE
jgi:hypothetical protein